MQAAGIPGGFCMSGAPQSWCDLDEKRVARYHRTNMNDSSPSRQDKFRRYRAKKKAMGLREIRMWVPDVNAPGFQDRLDDQIARINASRSSQEALDWIDAVVADDPDVYR